VIVWPGSLICGNRSSSEVPPHAPAVISNRTSPETKIGKLRLREVIWWVKPASSSSANDREICSVADDTGSRDELNSCSGSAARDSPRLGVSQARNAKIAGLPAQKRFIPLPQAPGLSVSGPGVPEKPSMCSPSWVQISASPSLTRCSSIDRPSPVKR